MATLSGVIAVIMWGLLAVLGSITKSIPAFQLLFLCFVISATIILVRRRLSGEPLLTPPRLSAAQWVAGIVGLFGFHFCYFMALKQAAAIEVSLIVYLWPLLLSVMVATSGHRLGAIIGGVIGFIGIALIITDGSELAVNPASLTGYLLALLCALIWSGYSWFLSRTPGKVDDIGWISAAVALLSLLAHLWLEPVDWAFSMKEWLGIILLGLGPVGGAFYLWDHGLKYGNRQLLASLSFSAPLISAISLAVAGLNDWSIKIVAALVLILLGAVIANRKPKRRAQKMEVLS